MSRRTHTLGRARWVPTLMLLEGRQNLTVSDVQLAAVAALPTASHDVAFGLLPSAAAG